MSWEKYMKDVEQREMNLITNLKTYLPEYKELLKEVNHLSRYEDLVYRYYHRSYKVYSIQRVIQRITEVLQKLVPDQPFNHYFQEILLEGASGKQWEKSHNDSWGLHTRPIIEDFLHTYFLEMAVKYGEMLSEPVEVLPFG